MPCRPCARMRVRVWCGAQVDPDHMGKLKRIEELKALLAAKEREILQLTEESFRLQLEHDELKAAATSTAAGCRLTVGGCRWPSRTRRTS